MKKRHTTQDYSKRSTADVALFTTAMKEGVASRDGKTFDSAAADDFVSSALNQNSVQVPAKLAAVLDEVPEAARGTMMRAVFDGIHEYESQHGISVPADVVEQAIHSAYTYTAAGRKERGAAFDSANSGHSDNLSLQPNRAVVAILSTLTEAIPVAHYLPADIGSNEAKLAILSHNAGATLGQYAEGALMDGASSGGAYLSSSRVHKCAIDGSGNITGKLTKIQTDAETCAPGAGDLKLLRGRSLVYVNGREIGREVSSTGAGASAVSGSVVLGSTTHAIAGSINTDTGVIALTSAPPIPTNTPVHVEGFIDFERDESLIPQIITGVDTYTLHAKPWRAFTQQTIDARTQISNELGLDAFSEGLIAIQTQFANERHYDVINKLVRLAAATQREFDFDWASRKDQMNRAQIWLDFGAVLGELSQQVVLNTMSYGLSYMYCTKSVASQMLSLPREVFEPSGLPERAGVYRVGRLFGRYEVYYTPKGLTETPDGKSAQILLSGRAPDVTRNPIVLGDAVPPTVQTLGLEKSLKQGAAFYARNFTSVNPHGPSSQGCAMINVINLK